MTKYNLIDFIDDIAKALDDASDNRYGKDSFLGEATWIYQDFIMDEAKVSKTDGRIILPRFGLGGYDWDADGASELAQAYSIDFWE